VTRETCLRPFGDSQRSVWHFSKSTITFEVSRLCVLLTMLRTSLKRFSDTRKPPRPDLPEAINEQLEFDDSGQETAPTPEDSIAELREQTFYADAAPADPSVLNEDADGDRTLDELFG